MSKKCSSGTAVMLCVVIALCAATSALAYPTSGNHPRAVPEHYSKLRAEKAVMSFGEVRFATKYPEQLTDAERFVIFGCDPATSAKPYPSMISELFIVLSNYYMVTGQIPEEISDEVIMVACSSVGQTPRPALLELLKSPLTGLYPRLDCKDFSRGDYFVKVLSAEEINHIARHDGNLNDRLGESASGSAAHGPIFYFRAYGESEVIFSELKYAWN
jgi:hypothetical protein